MKYARLIGIGALSAGICLLSSAASAALGPIRIEAGAPQGGTIDGVQWVGDQFYEGGRTVDRKKRSITNTTSDRLYQTERYGLTAYKIPVENGVYTVKLHFAETYRRTKRIGQRVFNVNVEGKGIQNIDIYKETGGRNIALVKTITGIPITDRRMEIYFTRISGAPMINAIEVIPESQSPTPPPPPTPTPPLPQPPTSGLPQCSYDVSKLRSAKEWESLFLKIASLEHSSVYLPKSQSLDSWQFYNLGYAIDAYTAMYEATRKKEYLDRVLLYVGNVITNAKPSNQLPSGFRDGYLGWVSARSDTRNQEIPLFESYMWRYVARMLRVMKETGIYRDPAYASRYNSILAFSERNIFDKWYSRSPNSYIYRSRTHMASHWAYIASNLSLLTSDASRKAKYNTVVENVNYRLPNYRNANGSPASLHGQMQVISAGGAPGYFYSDAWGVMSGTGSDYSHGGNTIAYIVDANQTGIGGWTKTDMDRLIVTLDKVLWKGPGSYAAYLNGSGSGGGWWNEGWIKLGRFCPALQKRLETHTVGRGVQFYANGTLNATFLESKK